MAKINYIYFLKDKDMIVSDRFDEKIMPKKGGTIKDYYGSEYKVKQIIPSSDIDCTSHVIIESNDDFI